MDGGGLVVEQLGNGLELADELPSGDRAIFDGAFDRASNLAVARVAFEPEHIAPLRDREEEFYDRVIRGGAGQYAAGPCWSFLPISVGIGAGLHAGHELVLLSRSHDHSSCNVQPRLE